MAPISKDALWSLARDGRVEVNQRALIDKVLARYSAKFAVFRELLQNSDDASSKAVEIRFETRGYMDRGSNEDQASYLQDEPLPDLGTTLVHRWTLKNNGMLFRDEDWGRLKNIAEGNPDEDKIGAFGVGFYTVFSVTEKPFVTSGGQWMGFYWKDGKDQLFFRRGKFPKKMNDPWTTFEMDLREPAPIPSAFEFTKFLVSSITFMTHLCEVSVYFDDKRLVHLNKDVGIPEQLAIPQGLRPTSRMGSMSIKGLTSTPLEITAEVMGCVRNTETPKLAYTVKLEPWSFPSSTPECPPSVPHYQPAIDETEYLDVSQSGIVLTIYTAEVDVNINQALTTELRRAMKKDPPRTLKYQLLYTGKDGYDANKEEDDAQSNAAGSLFRGMRADLDESGFSRVFIGHATVQTTGIGGHMAARFIPTAERDSIDLVNRNVAVWNEELLSVGGFLARAAYELEMQDLGSWWDKKQPGEALDAEVRRWCYDQARHILRFFAFHPSTPSPIVSNQMQSAFFDCAVPGQPFPIISSVGIKATLDVRMPDPALSGFLKELPIFPKELLDTSNNMVTTLQKKGMLKDITPGDVLKELKKRPLPEEEMVTFLQWYIDTSRKDQMRTNRGQTGSGWCTDGVQRELLGAAVLIVDSPETGDKRAIPLKGIRTILDPEATGIPRDGPPPNHLLPISISQKLNLAQLKTLFQWRWFTFFDWVDNIVDPPLYSRKSEFSITESPAWADHVLQVLSKYWKDLPTSDSSRIISRLGNRTCIPTSTGMKKPSEAYFSSTDIFHDLPVVNFPTGDKIKGDLERLLVDLGVRKHPDLDVIYNMMVETNDWSIQEIVQYLISINSTLEPAEIKKFQSIPAFPKETTTNQDEDEDGLPTEVLKFKASDLYAPSVTFRSIGLPVLDWQGKEGRLEWVPTCKEAKFLFNLGLKRYPPTEDILDIAAKGGKQGTAALDYFLKKSMWRGQSWDPSVYADVAFIPAIHHGKKKLVKPSEVFLNPDWGVLGFPILDINLGKGAIQRLRIDKDPPTSYLIYFLKEFPLTTKAQGHKLFQLFSRRSKNSHAYADIAFVPAIHQGKEKLVKPSEVFSNPDWGVLGFPILDPDLGQDVADKLGINKSPSTSNLVHLLVESPPVTEAQAQKWFGLLSHIQDFHKSQLHTLSVTPIVPTSSSTPTHPQLLPPDRCYFKGKSHSKPYTKLFAFIDFGTSANRFLEACGTKGEPTAEEIASILLKDPQQFLQLADGWDNYLAELHNIAVNSQQLSKTTFIELEKAPTLIGSRRVKSQKSNEATGLDDEDDWTLEYSLLAPHQVTIADDMITLQQFGEAIFCAPQDSTLEDFYRSLGCKCLSDIVQEEHQTTQEIHGHERAQEVRSLILERLPLFLHHRTRMGTQDTPEWPGDKENFVIRMFEGVTVTRSIELAGVELSKSFEASAVVKQQSSPVELWLATNTPVDMYEVATSLCRLLFRSCTVNDTLMLTTVLSTDLRTLRRRGYNVDPILKRQRA